MCCGFRDAARAGHGILGVCCEKSLLVARQRDAGEPELVCAGGGCEGGGGLKGAAEEPQNCFALLLAGR